MKKQIIVGIIGAGRIGKIHIDNVMKKIPDFKLKAVADINLDSELKSWADRTGIPKLISDPCEIIDDAEIEAVIIASSTDSHSDLIQKSAKACKSIFCEKPLDTNLERIKKTLKIVDQEKAKLMIGFNRRFDPNFKRMKEVIQSGQIGTPHMIKITSRDPRLPPIDYLKGSGGLFVDMTIHDWDMAQYQVESDIDEVYARGEALIDPKVSEVGDIDTAIIVLNFKNGALGVIDNSRQAVYGYDQRVEVFGSSGCVTAGNQPSNTIRIFTSDSTKQDNIPYFFLERYMDSYEAELSYFCKCIQENEEPSPNGIDGLKSVLVALAANKSFREHRPVRISEINY